MTKITIEIPLEETDAIGGIACGLRQEWITAESESLKIELSAGAGTGSPWISIRAEVPKGVRYFRYDMRKFLAEFAQKIADEIDPEDTKTEKPEQCDK